jgi:hypothetical protein
VFVSYLIDVVVLPTVMWQVSNGMRLDCNYQLTEVIHTTGLFCCSAKAMKSSSISKTAWIPTLVCVNEQIDGQPAVPRK